MTDVVTISSGRRSAPLETARTFTAAGHTDGWVVPNNDTLISDVVSEVAAGPYDAFAETSSGTSYVVTIGTGEALVGGGALVRDVTTDVTLAAGTLDQTVYLGWAHNAQDTVKIGLDAAFNADDPRIPIYTYDTDGSGVTAVTDERPLGAQLNIQNARYEGGGIRVDAAKSADTADNAQALGSALPSSYLRSDQDDTIDGRFYVNNHGFGGTPGIALAVGDTDTGLHSTADGVLEFWANAIAVAQLDNQRFGFQIPINLNGNEARGMRIENRTNRPSGVDPGHIIYRSDRD